MHTDLELKNEVLKELKWEPTVSEGDITIDVNAGVVTLSGRVPHYAEKWAAQRAVQRVEGVKTIADKIEVRLQAVHHRDDTELATAIANALKWHVWVPGHVRATVEKGWVTLIGSVKWEYERSAAEDTVSFLSGVTGVTNKIILKPNVEPTAVKDAIENALKRNAEIDAERINVSTEGAKVTLAGTVNSWDEREEAGAAAWNAPGVIQVQNDLAIAS